jgi:hypothetical protein
VESYVDRPSSCMELARSCVYVRDHVWTCTIFCGLDKIGVEIYEKKIFFYLFRIFSWNNQKSRTFRFWRIFFGQKIHFKIFCCKLLGHQFYIVLCKNETYPTSGTLRKQGLSFLHVYIWFNAWSSKIMHELVRSCMNLHDHAWSRM